jgi:hypothetical protein
MLDESVELLEGIRVEQELDPLARRELPFAVLAFLAQRAAALGRALQSLFEILQRIAQGIVPSTGVLCALSLPARSTAVTT